MVISSKQYALDVFQNITIRNKCPNNDVIEEINTMMGDARPDFINMKSLN